MRIEFDGAKELSQKLKSVSRKYPRERDMFLRGEAEVLLSRVKPLTPVDTGRLRYSWQRTEPMGGSVDVYNNTEYACYVEFGHRVKYFGRYTGNVVPGVFMLREAVDACADNFQADATKLLARIFS